MLSLPDSLLARTGPIEAIEWPAQGMNFEVAILTAARGRFVLKVGRTPEKIAELDRESGVLHRLRDRAPFVAAPVGRAVAGDSGLFLFTCIEGETLVEALARADPPGRHALLAAYARTIRGIHGWTPDFPRPADWLGDALERAARNVAAKLIPNPLPARYGFAGADPRALLAGLQRRRAAITPDIVFGHGDTCLPNAIVRDGAIVGMIDWSGGGYADRRYDLAATCWSIGYNLGDAAYRETFLNAYGEGGAPADLDFFEALYVLL